MKHNALQELVEKSAGVDANGQPVRPPLTIRNPDAILALPLDSHDNLLGDRLLAKGQSLTILGPGGVGKSRMVLQLAASSISGRPFVGLETHQAGMRWLILQVENGNRRLSFDLAHLKEALKQDWKTVNERLFIHTLETDRDGWLALDSPENLGSITQAIEEYEPDIISFDPLNQFAIGDPNKDADMMATCAALTRLCRTGNPHRAIVVLHHTLTGRAGQARSVGAERGGYGRNSKVLQAWTRGQINLTPISDSDNDTLAVSCGKCSNGKEFPPFAVRLNLATMIYEPAPDVDIEGWRAAIAGKPAGPVMTPQRVRELCQLTGTGKPDLGRAIIADCGCSRATAYRYIAQAEERKVIRWNKTNETYFRN